MKNMCLALFSMVFSLSSIACDWNEIKQSAEQTAKSFCNESNGIKETLVSMSSVVRGELQESQFFVTCKDDTKLIGSIDVDYKSSGCNFVISLGPVSPL